MNPRQIVDEFWRLMASNDFASVKQVLSDDFVCEWPMSGERIVGAQNFIRAQSEYPANGPWRFARNRTVVGTDEVVTDVSVSDGVQHARAVSFFTVRAGLISKLVELWPEPSAPPANRRHLVEPL